jgi:hypothetical protein
MPRGTPTQGRGRFHEIQAQARRLLRRLTREIRIKEAELRSLRDDEAKLVAAIGQRNGSSKRVNRSGPRKGSSRINWLAVLERLPKEFKASHIGAVSAVKHKRPSERFAAISRWIDAKMVKRKSRGIYERVNKKKSKS